MIEYPNSACEAHSNIRVSEAICVACIMNELSLWHWLTEMRCTVQENSAVGEPKWTVLDVDDDILGRGDTPQAAIKKAKEDWERWQ